MADTPVSVRVPVSFPLYMRLASGDFVEVAVIEDMVDVTVTTSRQRDMLAHEAWLERFREDAEAHKDEDLSKEPDAW